MLDHLQQIVSRLPVTRRTEQTIFLEDPRHTALVRLNYLQQKKTWLLTAYEKAPSAGRTIDVPGTHAAERQAPPPGGVESSSPEGRTGDSETSIARLERTEKPGERGSFSLKPTEPPGPRLNYSGLGRAQDVTVRNLSQLEKADSASHAAVVRAATAKSQAAVLIQRAAPRIGTQQELKLCNSATSD